MTKKVYIVLVNYNGWKDTIECLESVLTSDYINYQVIVIDNDSPNNSMEYIIDWAEGRQDIIYPKDTQLKHLSFPFEQKPLDYILYSKDDAIKGGNKEKEANKKNPLVFIQAGTNGGFAAGNNIGIKYALAKDDFEYIWLLNNDTIVEKDSLRELIIYQELNSTSLTGSVIGDYGNNSIKEYGCHVNLYFCTTKKIYNRDKIDKVNYVSGASVLISRKCFSLIGFLSENYFLYYEDVDYSLMVTGYGEKIGIAERSLVYHKEGKSTSIGKKYSNNLVLHSLYLKNKYLFGLKFGRSRILLWLSMFLSFIKCLLNFELSVPFSVSRSLRNKG